MSKLLLGEQVIEDLRKEGFIECIIDPNRKPSVYVQVDMVGELWKAGEANTVTLLIFNETNYPYNCPITGRIKLFNCSAKITNISYTQLTQAGEVTHTDHEFTCTIDLEPGIIYKVTIEVTPDECTAAGTLILEVDKAPSVVSSGRFHGNVRIARTIKCPGPDDCGEERTCEGGEKPGDQPCRSEITGFSGSDCGCR